MFNVRNFTGSDFEMIQSWWKTQNEFPPTLEMLPEESTFICEFNKNPMVAVTLYLTNSKEFCMLDNFVGNPEQRGELRKEASQVIVSYAEAFAKELGYKSIMCMSLKNRLSEYYQSFGYIKRLTNVSTFNKELV
jgi:hypothetical protein